MMNSYCNNEVNMEMATIDNEKVRRRRRFTPEEDMKIKEIIIKEGLNWDKILPQFPHKTKRQLKDRWVYYLNPELKAAPFTTQEDILLETKLFEMGPKWRKMVVFFPGRTDVALKNRWKMIQRHRIDGNSRYQKRRKLSPHSSSPETVVESMHKENEDKVEIEPMDNAEIFQEPSFDMFDTFEFDFDIHESIFM